MNSSHSHGLTMQNGFGFCPATTLRSRQYYTMAHPHLATSQARCLLYQSAHLLRASSTPWTAFSSSRTLWGTPPLANGGWFALCSPTALLSPHYACRMGGSSWNSTLYIMLMFALTQPTSDIGCNIMQLATSPCLPLQHRLI